MPFRAVESIATGGSVATRLRCAADCFGLAFEKKLRHAFVDAELPVDDDGVSVVRVSNHGPVVPGHYRLSRSVATVGLIDRQHLTAYTTEVENCGSQVMTSQI